MAKSEKDKIDSFYFIDNLQTTVRQLKVFSAIILQLNNKQLPKKILEQLLTNWSIAEELKNREYKNGKGKITNNGVKTAAIGYYLQASSFLGITTRFNDVYMNTKMSQTFLYFLLNTEERNKGLSLCEKVFYLYKLFTNDSDGIILCISQLIDSVEKKQHALQVEFKNAMNSRLISKMDISTELLKSKISTKYRTINFIWKSPEKYAEHIIAPRYEWLCSLGLVNVKREAKDTLYSLTRQGEELFKAIPNFGTNGLRDINQYWMKNYFFDIANQVFNNSRGVKFSELAEQDFELGQSLEKATKAVKSSLSFKLPISESFIFVCMDLFINRGIVINFLDIENKLNPEFSYNSRLYFLKLSGRPNEGYITITLKK